jgi:hypothetical protein
VFHKGSLPVLIAEKEKAILDYLYLNASLRSGEDIKQLRFNYIELHNNLDWEKLGKYQLVFASTTLDKRIKDLKKQLEHADII